MKRILMAAIPMLAASAWGDFPVEVKVAHPGRYACGEVASFEATLRDPKTQASPTNGIVTAVLSNYGTEVVASNDFDMAVSPTIRIEGALAKPGCLLLTLTGKPVRRNWGGGSFVYSVAYEPERIETGIAKPGDFDAYWDGEIARLEREVPLDPRLEPCEKYSSEKRDLYRVSFATFNGRRVWGFLSLPKNAGGRTFPTRVNVPGAGPGQCAFNAEGDDREVVLHLNVHYFEPSFEKGGNGKAMAAEAKECAAKFGGPGGNYALTGYASTREGYFYHDAIVGLVRAVNWLYERPEVDRTRFTYAGTSQGGGFGLILGGLTGRFTRLVAYVPALADHFAYRNHRRAGWPRFIDLRPGAADLARAEAIMPYYDTAFFASRITCPVRFIVGLSDSVCPPATGTAAYNACPSKDKALEMVPGMPHAVFKPIYAKYDDWLRNGDAAEK